MNEIITFAIEHSEFSNSSATAIRLICKTLIDTYSAITTIPT